MAKNDYHVIVYKILAYLYIQLKAGEAIDPEIINYDGVLCNIPQSYWTYIMEALLNRGYIQGITVKNTWGEVKMIENIEDCMITPEGIEYVCDNKLFKKVEKFLKEIKEITPVI